MIYNSHIHTFKAVVKSADVTFTYFSHEGLPLRANVELALAQFEPDASWGAQNPTSGTPSPHRTHQLVVGDSLDRLAAQKVALNYCRVRAFPFSDAVREFIEQHEVVYVVEQNRDAQLRTLLMLDSVADPAKLVPLLHYNGIPLNAGFVVTRVLEERAKGQAA